MTLRTRSKSYPYVGQRHLQKRPVNVVQRYVTNTLSPVRIVFYASQWTFPLCKGLPCLAVDAAALQGPFEPLTQMPTIRPVRTFIRLAVDATARQGSSKPVDDDNLTRPARIFLRLAVDATALREPFEPPTQMPTIRPVRISYTS
jgi:hypothetical protein